MDLFLLSFIDSMETYEQMNIKRRALVPGSFQFDMVWRFVAVRRANGCSGPWPNLVLFLL